MQHNTVFVSGGTGGIGGAAVHDYVRRGWRVIAPVRDLQKPEAQALTTLPLVDVFRCNVEDSREVSQLIQSLKNDRIILNELFLAAGTFLWDDGFPGPLKTAEEVETLLLRANLETKTNVIAALDRFYPDEVSDLTIHLMSSHAANFPPDHPFRNGPYREEKYVFSMAKVSGLGHQLRISGRYKEVITYEPGLINTLMAQKAFTVERVGLIDWDVIPTPEQYIRQDVFKNVA